MDAWEESSIESAVVAGVATEGRLQVWVRGHSAGPHHLRAYCAGELVAQRDVELSEERDHTAVVILEVPDRAGSALDLHLCVRGDIVARGRGKLSPGRDARAGQRFTFAVASCHQPFTEEGAAHPGSASMLRAARAQFEADDVAFALLMGDQLYTDAPATRSLFDAEYFASLGEGDDVLECSASVVRRIFHRRYRRFLGAEGFAQLLASIGTIPMPDDHEFIDNFGTHPDHDTERWAAFKEGALRAYGDYQGARASLASTGDGTLDYGFTWGPLAVYGLDIRSNRATTDGKTRAYLPSQLDALAAFLQSTASMPVLALMTSIPLVYAEPSLVETLASALPKGSDLHERWSHSSCIEARDAVLGLLLDHSKRNPQQKVVLLGGDVHAGSAYEIDFPYCGVQMLQLTSSPLSNEEGWLNARAGELAARVVSSIELGDGRSGSVTALRGRGANADQNPFGGLNLGLVDISTDAEGTATVGFRLVSHDGAGAPKTVFDTGPIGRRAAPDRALLRE